MSTQRAIAIITSAAIGALAGCLFTLVCFLALLVGLTWVRFVFWAGDLLVISAADEWIRWLVLSVAINAAASSLCCVTIVSLRVWGTDDEQQGFDVFP